MAAYFGQNWLKVFHKTMAASGGPSNQHFTEKTFQNSAVICDSSRLESKLPFWIKIVGFYLCFILASVLFHLRFEKQWWLWVWHRESWDECGTLGILKSAKHTVALKSWHQVCILKFASSPSLRRRIEGAHVSKSKILFRRNLILPSDKYVNLFSFCLCILRDQSLEYVLGKIEYEARDER